MWYEADVLLVKKHGKYGLINYKGNELLKCEYNSITTVKGIKNSLITEKDGKLGLVDDIGNIVIPNEYKSIKPLGNKYEEGFIVGNEKYGVINWDKSVPLEIVLSNVNVSNKYEIRSLTVNGGSDLSGKKTFTIDNDFRLRYTLDLSKNNKL